MFRTELQGKSLQVTGAALLADWMFLHRVPGHTIRRFRVWVKGLGAYDGGITVHGQNPA